mgnify:CR=1 FL=1
MSVRNGHLRQSDGHWCSIRRVTSQPLGFRFFGCAGAVGMHFDARAVEAQTIYGYADHMVFLKHIKQPIQNTRVGPTAHPGVNRVPLAELWRQGYRKIPSQVGLHL